MDEWLKFNTGRRAVLNGSFTGKGSPERNSFKEQGRQKKNKPRPLRGRGKVSYTSLPGHIQALTDAEKASATTFCRLFSRLLMLFHDRF